MTTEVNSILKICGIGSYLHIGDSNNTPVFELLKRSIDAYGIDRSDVIISQHSQRAPGRFTIGSLSNYPFKPASFDTIIIGSELFNFDVHNLALAFKSLLTLARRNLVLYFPPQSLQFMSRNNIANRLLWEKLAIQAGFRRHPREMLVTPYDQLENESMGTLTFFERIPDAALERFSMQWLLENRDLHMDMLREAGRRSDGHVSRYFLATSKIDAGDTVLDAACGLGYGTAVMAACSPGARFIGVDLDPESIAYANANFASTNPAISYQPCDITNLSFIPDHSIDVVVTFETIEHIPDYNIFLAEIKRVLKPDGRVIGSVPNLWCDETGKDPNPYHFHVFDWEKLKNAVSQYFIVDGRWVQIAGGGYKVHHGKRQMYPLPLAYSHPIESEWWIFSAHADPRHAAATPYTNPFSKQAGAAIPAHVAFEKYYDNPWLYRTLVQQGVRIMDDDTLGQLCIDVANTARPGSADHGAALCVLAYRLLESGYSSQDSFMKIAGAINKFDEAYDRNNPHAQRWAISLHFVAARLLLAIGNRDDAYTTFLTCAAMDPLRFCPLLATKTVSSRMYAGLILVGNGKTAEAREQFQLGVTEAHRVMQGDWKNIIGDFEQPLLFALPEAADVLTLASQCAQAVNALDKHSSVPGYFWDRINLKFFGLVEWNRNLENENKKLRQELHMLAMSQVPVT